MLTEIVTGLFSRLPIKSIIRRLYNQSSNTYTLFLCTAKASTHASLIEYLANDHLIVIAKQFNLMDLVHKHENLISDFSVLTSCNDMLLCRVIDNHGDCTSESLRLMNLVTGTYMVVGRSPLVKQGSSIRYEFGYSPCATRYKVLRFDIDKVIKRNSTVKILTVNSDADDYSWRPIDTDKSDVYNEISDHITYLVNPVVLNNSIHWIIATTNNILRFDLDKEEFELVPKPSDKDLSIGQLSAVDGFLCILAIHEKQRSDRVEVWVMKQYGMQDSWTQLAVVNDFNIDVPLKLIRVLDNGKFLFQCNNRLSLYDPIDEKWDEKVIKVPMKDPVIRPFILSKSV